MAKKKTRDQKCGNCRKKGHNSRTCENKSVKKAAKKTAKGRKK